MNFPLSSFTLGLAIIGGLVLAALVAWQTWTSRRNTPRQPQPAGSAPAAAPADPLAERNDPVFDAEADIDPVPLPLPEKRPGLDALIDVIAPIVLEAPVSGEAALAAMPTTRRAGSKPFAIEGLNVESGEWEAPAAGARYREFQAGVQLANRTGPLNEIEYSEFVQKAQAFADGVGAAPDFPDMLDVVARARELDAFAGQHDAQLAVRLHARAVAWSPGYIHQHASRHGFIAGSVPGRLVLPSPDDGAPPVLSLTFDAQAALADDPNQSSVNDVTLSFDVPQTDPSAEPFAAWQASAQALALGMDAAVVDDNGRPLDAAGFEAIGRELAQLYDALAQRDLAAGSAAARRLFS